MVFLGGSSKATSQFSFSSSVRSFMIIELVLVVPRSTGLDSNFSFGGCSSARGCSSVGRAPDLHSGGRRFDPDQLHQVLSDSSRRITQGLSCSGPEVGRRSGVAAVSRN